jgi:hypothetical protein
MYFGSPWNLVDGVLVLVFAALGFTLARGGWLEGKYLAVVMTMLIVVKFASLVGMFTCFFQSSSDYVLTLLACCSCWPSRSMVCWCGCSWSASPACRFRHWSS